jgi:Flp pilus assembly protein TadG
MANDPGGVNFGLQKQDLGVTMLFSFGRNGRQESQRGHAVVEVALLSPWIFMLFAGTFDLGMYGYALISTQNAARAAAVYTSTSTTTAANTGKACQYALAEMSAVPNLTGVSTCSALPLIVTAQSLPGADGATASQVTVTYRTPQLIPIPGLVGRLTVNRTVQMRCRQ